MRDLGLNPTIELFSKFAFLLHIREGHLSRQDDEKTSYTHEIAIEVSKSNTMHTTIQTVMYTEQH